MLAKIRNWVIGIGLLVAGFFASLKSENRMEAVRGAGRAVHNVGRFISEFTNGLYDDKSASSHAHSHDEHQSAAAPQSHNQHSAQTASQYWNGKGTPPPGYGTHSDGGVGAPASARSSGHVTSHSAPKVKPIAERTANEKAWDRVDADYVLKGGFVNREKGAKKMLAQVRVDIQAVLDTRCGSSKAERIEKLQGMIRYLDPNKDDIRIPNHSEGFVGSYLHQMPEHKGKSIWNVVVDTLVRMREELRGTTRAEVSSPASKELLAVIEQVGKEFNLQSHKPAKAARIQEATAGRGAA